MQFAPLAALAMAGILLAAPADAQPRTPVSTPSYVGRPVADVLRALQSPELRFFFTEASVPQTLLVKSEPKGRKPLEIARQILAEHGLALELGLPGQMIVVPATPPAAAKPAKGGGASPELSTPGPDSDSRPVFRAATLGQLSNPTTLPGGYALAPSTLGEMPGASDNVFNGLRMLPSVAAVNDEDGKLAVRGSGPEHNMILVEGVQIHNPYRLGTLTSSFLNPATTASVKLDPSGLEARHGGRLSSVTSIDLRDGKTDRALAVSGSLGLMAGDLLLEGRLPGNAGGSWWASARGTYYRPVVNQVHDEPVAGFGDAQFRMTLRPTARTRLTFYGLLGREMSDEPDVIVPADVFGIRTPDNKLRIEGPQYTGINRLGVMNLSWTPGPLTATTTVSTSAHEASERDATQVSVPPFERDLGVRDHSLGQRVLFSRGGNQLLDAGVEAHWLQSQWRMAGTEPSGSSYATNQPQPRGLGPSTVGELVEYTNGPIDTSLTRTQIGFWAQPRLPLGSRMALEPGVRLDWNSFTGEALWQPRVRLSGRVRSSFVWAGYARQAQTPSHEGLQGYDYVQLTAADGGRLKSERSDQIVAGVERTLRGKVSLRIETYWRHLDHLLVQRLESDAERALRLSRHQYPPNQSVFFEHRPTIAADSVGRGSSKGVEVQFERTVGIVGGFFSYTYSRSTREMYGDTFPADFDRPHAAKAVLFMKPWRRVRVAVTAERASGVPVTPLLQKVGSQKADGSWSMWPNASMRSLSVRNTERLNGYRRADVRVTYSTLGHWEIYGEMLNIFAGENFVQHVVLPPSSTSGPPWFDWEVARSYVPVPSFGILAKF